MLNLCGRGVLYTSVSDSPGHNDISELDTAVLDTSELDTAELDTAELDTAVLRSRTCVVESNNQKRKIHNIIDPVFCMIQTQEFEDISQRFFILHTV